MTFQSEVLVARLRPRLSALLIPTLALMLAGFLLGLLASRFTEPWQTYLVYGGCGILALFGFLVPAIRYLTTWTDITNSRVVVRSGLFGQHFDEVSIPNIEQIQLQGRTVLILVRDEDSLVLRNLPKPKLVAQTISDLVERKGF